MSETPLYRALNRVWVSRISGHVRTQGYEDADSLRSLKYIHPGSVDWKFIINSTVSVNLIERQRAS